MGDRDLPALSAAIDPKITIYQTEQLPWGGTYEGEAGHRAFLAKLFQHVQSEVTLEKLFEAGDRVVAIGRTVGETRAGQVPFNVRVVHVWTVVDGRVARFEAYIDTPAMLQALRG